VSTFNPSPHSDKATASSIDSFQIDFPRSHACLLELGRQMPFLLKATLDPSLVPIENRLPVLEEILEQIERLHTGKNTYLPQIVKSYVLLSMDFLKLQRLLEKTGRYLLSTERASLEEVYNNEKVFGGYYLEGLLLSQGLWPNHYRLGEAFGKSFVPAMSREGKVLEVGVGTGFHLNKLLSTNPALDYTGLDLSPVAIEFSKKYVGREAVAKAKVTFIEASITAGLPFADGTFPSIIMGEVLEHVERPAEVLRELFRVTQPGGRFFMTTVVFAANIDHIYLFHTADEIRELCRECGWNIEQDWVYPVYPRDTPDMRDRPMNVAFVLRK
jgi:SAM-dependent methyltransferase